MQFLGGSVSDSRYFLLVWPESLGRPYVHIWGHDLSWAYMTCGHILTCGGGTGGVALCNCSVSNVYRGNCSGLQLCDRVLISWETENVPAIPFWFPGDLTLLDQESGYFSQTSARHLFIAEVSSFNTTWCTCLDFQNLWLEKRCLFYWAFQVEGFVNVLLELTLCINILSLSHNQLQPPTHLHWLTLNFFKIQFMSLVLVSFSHYSVSFSTFGSSILSTFHTSMVHISVSSVIFTPLWDSLHKILLYVLRLCVCVCVYECVRVYVRVCVCMCMFMWTYVFSRNLYPFFYPGSFFNFKPNTRPLLLCIL